MMNRKEIEKRIKEIEDIPLYDVSGGRQRTSGENQEYFELKSKLNNV